MYNMIYIYIYISNALTFQILEILGTVCDWICQLSVVVILSLWPFGGDHGPPSLAHQVGWSSAKSHVQQASALDHQVWNMSIVTDTYITVNVYVHIYVYVYRWMDGMGWDGMGWDGMGWNGMEWNGMDASSRSTSPKGDRSGREPSVAEMVVCNTWHSPDACVCLPMSVECQFLKHHL